MTKISNPYPIFLDSRGALVDGGFVYIGEAGQDPQLSPVQAYFDEAMTIPAAQPIRTLGGYLVNEASPAFVYVAADDYSLRVSDANGVQITYTASSATVDPADYQPANDNLDDLAEADITSFGLSLLSLTGAAQLRSATEIPECLPKIGGQVSGNITRSGSGTHLYHAGTAFGSGRVFVTDASAGDPTSAAGDIWIKLDA